MKRLSRSAARFGADLAPALRSGRPATVAKGIRAPVLLLMAAALAAVASCAPPDPLVRNEPAPWTSEWRYAPETPAVAREGMVVTTDELATGVGLQVLRDGGSAIDAAVAVSFALAVVNPEAGNIGGGGFMVARLADGQVVTLDYREKAPAAATRDMYLDVQGNLTDGSVVGHLASGVPGTVAGMWEAHARFGSLDWDRLLQPAVALARGFPVRQRFLASLDPTMVEALSEFPASASQFLPRDGRPPGVGDTLRQPDLARTLERIRDRGADGFYRGETADRIVAEMERGGGLITRQDLAAYEAVWRDPVTFEYRGHTVHSMAPSSSGGVAMAETAAILEGWELGALPWDGADRVHLLVEAWRRAFADRNHYLGDTDFVAVPLDVLTDPEYGAFRRRGIDADTATPSARVGPGVEAFLGQEPTAALGAGDDGPHTTHFSIVDAEGNAVAVTTTINSWYGSKVTVTGAGFVLNNEMDDFAAKAGTPNQFGLVQGESNAIEPGKRMLSAMSPAIVEDPSGRLRMVTGTPGGATIITTVFQTISNVLDYGMSVTEAVRAPRVHHQHLPDQVYVEADGLSPEVVAELEARGHRVVMRSGVSGDVQAIVVLPDGTLAGHSDPRRGGVAAGY